MLSLKKLTKNSSSHGRTELKRIGYLDGWRGLAILIVLIEHFLTIPGIHLGRFGVDIFFVLSGLLMSKILFVKRVPLPTFYKRRLSRVFPVFFIYLTTLCTASYLFELSSEHENYFYSLFFLRSYFPTAPATGFSGIPIGNLWSLNVEEHCYIILSIITLFSVFKGKEFIPLIGLGIGAILIRCTYILYPDFAPTDYFLHTEVIASHLFLSAGYALIKENFERFVFSWLPIFTFFLSILCYIKSFPWFSHWLFSPFLLAFTVNHLDRIPEIFKTILSNKILQLFGICSYSIYLWQQPFYYYGVRFGEIFPYSSIVMLFLGITVGMISFYFIENPIRKYLNNKW